MRLCPPHAHMCAWLPAPGRPSCGLADSAAAGPYIYVALKSSRLAIKVDQLEGTAWTLYVAPRAQMTTCDQRLLYMIPFGMQSRIFLWFPAAILCCQTRGQPVPNCASLSVGTGFSFLPRDPSSLLCALSTAKELSSGCLLFRTCVGKAVLYRSKGVTLSVLQTLHISALQASAQLGSSQVWCRCK